MRGPKLFEGARVALIAPSSPVNGDVEAKLDRAVKTAEKLNLIPVLYPTARASHGYLAGTDEMRAKDINEAFADKDIDGIWCLRGGYGAHRILPLLDYTTIRENAKFFGGYSDITAFHIAFRQQCGFGTYHMTMPTSDNLIDGSEYSYKDPCRRQGRRRTLRRQSFAGCGKSRHTVGNRYARQDNIP